MRRLLLLFLLLAPAAFPYASFTGWCQQGGVQVTVAGQRSAQYTQQSYPNFTQSGAGPGVTVYYTGTTSKVTLYSDNAGTSLGNPFPCTTTGQYSFFANVNVADLLFSGTGISPFTRGATSGGPLTAYVTNFGAKGNGTADDTAAVQATINYLSNSGSNGGAAVVPYGSYKIGAITMSPGVVLTCESGTTFLARDNSEVMFTFGNGASYSGISGPGVGYCNISGNSKTGFQALEVGQSGGGGTNIVNTSLNNLYITGASVCLDAYTALFNNFQNLRCFLPSTAAFEFETGVTTTTCINCSAIAVAGTPYCFLIHNNGTINVDNGTCEGTMTSLVYQSNNDHLNIYYENSGGTNGNPWITIGIQNGSATSAIDLSGSTFSVGANYAVEIEQISGLIIHGATFSTALGAIRIDNSGSANGALSGIDIRGNAYYIGGAGYDPTKILIYPFGPANDLTNNLGTNSPDPLICTPVIPGTSVEPPSVALSNRESVGWCDGSTGTWNYKWKDGSGTIHRQIAVSDVGLSAVINPINLITPTGGSTSNAIVGSLTNADGTAVALTTGLVVLFPLTGGTSLQAGANTFNFNGNGALAIKTNSGQINLTTALANGGAAWLRYNGTYWNVLTQ